MPWSRDDRPWQTGQRQQLSPAEWDQAKPKPKTLPMFFIFYEILAKNLPRLRLSLEATHNLWFSTATHQKSYPSMTYTHRHSAWFLPALIGCFVALPSLRATTPDLGTPAALSVPLISITQSVRHVTPTALSGSDLDGDGLPDLIEIRFGSDPTLKDTDKDSWDDKAEYDAGTDPRDPESFPLFTVLARDKQFLTGDLIVLRARALTNGIVRTNFVIVTNDVPVTIGTPVDSDGDGVSDGCDVNGDGMKDVDGTCPESLVITNEVLVTNYIAFSWWLGTNALASQTNESLVIHRASTNDAGVYHLEATLMNSFQRGRTTRVEVLSQSAQVRLKQPAGHVLAWGTNEFGQSVVPVGVSEGLAVAGGFGHSILLEENRTAVAWGTNENGQINVPPDATNLVQVAAGAVQSLGLRADGTVSSWGTNEFAQLDLPEGLTNVTAVAEGYFHGMALRADGRVQCWGDNTYGQCNVPEDLPKVVAIAAGVFHSVALTVDGRVRCWGGNQAGQCDVPTSLPVVGAIAAGGNHTVAVLRNGTLVAWGDNLLKQLDIPPDLGNVTQVSAGYNFTVATKPDGSLALWPDLKIGLLPIPKEASNIVALSAGYFHVLALVGRNDTDTDGLDDGYEVKADTDRYVADTDGDSVEDGVELRLGMSPLVADTDGDGLPDRTELDNRFDPTVATEAPDGSLTLSPAVELTVFALGQAPYQLQVSTNGETWDDLGDPVELAPGTSSSLLDPPPGAQGYRWLPMREGPIVPPSEENPRPVVGTTAVWGNNDLGQGQIPKDLSGVAALSAGAWHTLALLTDGTVKGWGLNLDGQSTPPPDLSGAISVSAGGHHSLALLADGSVVAWGRNDAGQGESQVFSVPAIAIAAGGYHSLALLEGGTVAAWGSDNRGEIQVPSGLGTATAVAAGWSHSVALLADGSVVCWGDNRFGQCNVPVGLGPVKAVAAGDGHTLALLRSGSVVCWGNNENGQSQPPEGLTDVVFIDGGYNRSLALRSDGRMIVWGEGADALNAILATYPPPVAVSVGGYHVVAVKTPHDSDFDGLDDFLEAQLGTDPNSTDTDGDQLDDGTEYLGGFDPLSATEAVDGTTTVSFAVKLRYFTLSGGTYRLEASPNLENWRRIGGTIRNRRGFTELLLSVPNQSEYYRLLRVQ
ncbi:MAG TPA: hypothetical protein DCE44_10475 [Verrucomicrobiales bacterium]|nr:hypothetical protein [Verrucomicrobiales bacterium]